MIEPFLPTLTFVAAVRCGLAAGIFYAFSSLVMRALARIPSPAGIAAMQSINVSVVNPWFITAFFGPVSWWLYHCCDGAKRVALIFSRAVFFTWSVQ